MTGGKTRSFGAPTIRFTAPTLLNALASGWIPLDPSGPSLVGVEERSDGHSRVRNGAKVEAGFVIAPTGALGHSHALYGQDNPLTRDKCLARAANGSDVPRGAGADRTTPMVRPVSSLAYYMRRRSCEHRHARDTDKCRGRLVDRGDPTRCA